MPNLVDVAGYGAIGDGVADDTAAINRAMQACAAQGGGTVLFPAGKTYRVRRINPGAQWPGGIVLLPGCSLSGYGATIYVDDDTVGVGTPLGSSPYTIEADVSAGDQSLTLNSVAGLAVGKTVFFFYDQIATNPVECSSYGYAVITGISGNQIKLDRMLADPMTVATTPAGNRSVFLPQIIENVSIEGLSFVANWSLGRCIEAAIWIQFGRNLTLKDLTVTEPGCGIYLQYVDGALLENIVVTSAAQTNGGNTDFGHGLTFGESRNVRVIGFECSNFAKNAVDIEAACHNLWFDQIVLHDTDPNAFPQMEYFGSGDGSDFSVGLIVIDGKGYISGQTRGSLATANGSLSCQFNTVIDRTENGVGWEGWAAGGKWYDGPQLDMSIKTYVRVVP